MCPIRSLRLLQAAIAQLDKMPRRTECLARRGRQLASVVGMESVYGYIAGILNEASLRQQPDVARQVVKAERSRLVTKHNYFSFIPPAKRPWMEHMFRHWHRDLFNETALLPPHSTETGSGLFH